MPCWMLCRYPCFGVACCLLFSGSLQYKKNSHFLDFMGLKMQAPLQHHWWCTIWHGLSQYHKRLVSSSSWLFPIIVPAQSDPAIKHHLHFAHMPVCEQKFQIIHLSACTITLNIPPQIAVTKQWSYFGVWLYFKITHQFCGLYSVSLLFCPWGWQLSWDVLADAGFLSDKSAVLREQQRDTLYFQIIYWGSLFENFIQSVKIFLSGSFFQERLHHQARIPYEGPWSWFWQNVCEYWLKILQTALLLLKVIMWSDVVNLVL